MPRQAAHAASNGAGHQMGYVVNRCREASTVTSTVRRQGIMRPSQEFLALL